MFINKEVLQVVEYYVLAPLIRTQTKSTFYFASKCAYLFNIKDRCTRQIPAYVPSESLELSNPLQGSFFGHMKDELNLSHCDTFDYPKQAFSSRELNSSLVIVPLQNFPTPYSVYASFIRF